MGLYNKFDGFKRTVQKAFLRLETGGDLEKQMALAARLFPPPADSRVPAESYLNDAYGHPLELKYGYGEILCWLDRQGVTYKGSHPSLCVGKFWNILLSQITTSKNAKIQRIARVAPKVVLKEQEEGRPNIFARGFVQMLMLFTSQEMFCVVGVKR